MLPTHGHILVKEKGKMVPSILTPDSQSTADEVFWRQIEFSALYLILKTANGCHMTLPGAFLVGSERLPGICHNPWRKP